MEIRGNIGIGVGLPVSARLDKINLAKEASTLVVYLVVPEVTTKKYEVEMFC
jgi:hypothetical protein